MSKRCVIKPLTSEESALLAEHELTISQGLGAFVAVGLALLEIRQNKLYRAEYRTFEDYLHNRWTMSRAHGYRMIEAAQVVEKMSPNGRQMIENERQARALAAVPPHMRAEVLEQAKEENAELTEQSVTRIVCRLLDEKRQAAREAPATTSDTEEEDEEIAEGEEGEEEAAESKDESEEDADDADDEDANGDDGDEGDAEPTTASTLHRSAKKNEKPRLFLPRGLEHLRLAIKDLRKVEACDLGTEDARQAIREGLDAADEQFSRLRLLAAEEDD